MFQGADLAKGFDGSINIVNHGGHLNGSKSPRLKRIRWRFALAPGWAIW